MASFPKDAVTHISGTFYRMIIASRLAKVLAPAKSPEGRSHYDGQPALYLSHTPEGTAVAVKRYMQPDDPARAVCSISVSSANIVDLRDLAACRALTIDPSKRTVEWQELRAKGLRSPTWDISDRVRELGLDGMLYASRTQPSLTHLTLFKWNDIGGPAATVVGQPIPFPFRSLRSS